MSGLPLIDSSLNIRNAIPYFQSQGVKFPKGCFAISFASKQTMIVSAPSDIQSIFAFVLD
jgi:hypothetical protein